LTCALLPPSYSINRDKNNNFCGLIRYTLTDKSKVSDWGWVDAVTRFQGVRRPGFIIEI